MYTHIYDNQNYPSCKIKLLLKKSPVCTFTTQSDIFKVHTVSKLTN